MTNTTTIGLAVDGVWPTVRIALAVAACACSTRGWHDSDGSDLALELGDSQTEGGACPGQSSSGACADADANDRTDGCIADCAETACGLDGCGGWCGQCEEGNPCTSDSCEAEGQCDYEQVAGCVPCLDDCDCPDVGQACDATIGWCIEIPGTRYDSSDTPIAISDASAVMYLSTIHVNDQGPVINGSVKVRIQHEHMGDLKMRIAHAGLVLDLKYVDPADTSQSLCVTYPVGLVPSTGQMGDWQLEVWDTATPWGGELVSWSLFLE